jgi:hypothetical protein
MAVNRTRSERIVEQHQQLEVTLGFVQNPLSANTFQTLHCRSAFSHFFRENSLPITSVCRSQILPTSVTQFAQKGAK